VGCSVDGSAVDYILDKATERLTLTLPCAGGRVIDDRDHLHRPAQRQAARLLPQPSPTPMATCSDRHRRCRRRTAAELPLWDEPAFKAVFSSRSSSIGAHRRVERTGGRARQRGDGKQVVRFADTMPMSTYLVAFVVGAPVPSRSTAGIPLHRARARQGHLAFAAEISAFAIDWFQRYYGIPIRATRSTCWPPPDFPPGRWKPGLHHLPRACCSSTRPRAPRRTDEPSPTSSPTSWRTCGSATW
jgi:puromycin-sensitive aminopeptidase